VLTAHKAITVVGKILGHYEIIDTLGAGGMGDVYRARDQNLDREVAVKVLPADFAEDAGRLARFDREAKLLAALSHPNIAAIHSFEEFDGVRFLVLELIEGESLQARLANEPLPVRDAVSICAQIAEALRAAHSEGIVHRDLKPANVVIDPGGQAKVLDFGIAKAVQAAKADDATGDDQGGAPHDATAGDPVAAPTAMATELTRTGTVLGTGPYMSPEQVRGNEIDGRADIWALGCLLYEMLTGEGAFVRETLADTLSAVLSERPRALADMNAATGEHPELQAVVDRCLEVDVEKRFHTVDEFAAALEPVRLRFSGEAALIAEAAVPAAMRPLVRHPLLGATAAVSVLIVMGWLGWSYLGARRAQSARETVIPEIERLINEDNYAAAFSLARESEEDLGDDPTLAALWSQMTLFVTIETEPDAADVSFRSLGDPDAPWQALGTTPVEAARIPRDAFWIRIERQEYEPVEELLPPPPLEYAGDSVVSYSFNLDEERGDGMVRIPASILWIHFAGFETMPTFRSPSYLIDRYEVTNEQFKRFVDEGGYRTPELWKHRFVRDGQDLAWEQSMAAFRDRSNRPGPSTWNAGTYPEGQGSLPVTGVSWYEAAAYAEFMGKSLPTLYHWMGATSVWEAELILPFANIQAEGLLPVESTPVSLHGTADMAGNAREWIWNASGQGRYLVGGGWDDPPHMFFEPAIQPPFDRGETNGIRLMERVEMDLEVERTDAPWGLEVEPVDGVAQEPEMTVAADLFAPIERPLGTRSAEVPVTDEIFELFKARFDYDDAPFNDRVEGIDESSRYWTKQRVTFDAAYGGERMIAYVFLPKNVAPPYQPVVYWPGGGAVHLGNSADHLDSQIVEFLIMSGRAVVYPIYKGTYERNDLGLRMTDANSSQEYVDYVVWWIKDMRRTLDYMATRDDLDSERIGFLGFSWGARLASIALAVEGRIDAAVLLGAGINPQSPRPEVNETNYQPHVTIPVIMISGEHDAAFPLESTQKVMFDRLGTPAADKRHVLLPTGHFVMTQFRNQVEELALDWLDKYVGLVR